MTLVEEKDLGTVYNGKNSTNIYRPSVEYDYTISESQARDIDGIINKLNTTYQQDLKDEVEAENFFLN